MVFSGLLHCDISHWNGPVLDFAHPYDPRTHIASWRFLRRIKCAFSDRTLSPPFCPSRIIDTALMTA
jgi:hypothetical protein